jgi:LmbE family N-acetylglucosaminyl deacetylase
LGGDDSDLKVNWHYSFSLVQPGAQKLHNIVVFAPHPDDETLACGGTIALNTQKGNTVNIIFMTDGRYSHKHTLGIDSFPTPEDVMRIRREEAVKVADVLGVEKDHLYFLEYEDGKLADHLDEAQAKVEQILLKLKPDSIYSPARVDRHRDHKATNKVVRQSIQLLSPRPDWYQYVIWKSGKLSDLQPTSVDISQVLPIKKQAMAEYVSQLTLISERQRRPILKKGF